MAWSARGPLRHLSIAGQSRLCSNRSFSSQSAPLGSRRQKLATAQWVDPKFVNAHQCAIDQDATTKTVLKRIQRSLALLEKGQYNKAQKAVNPDGLSGEDFSASMPQNVAWAAANAAGVVLFHAGNFAAADHHLRTALGHCQALTTNGLAQDAYCDIAACLSDVAVNVLKWKGESDEGVNLLKRALYMAERAYRPNYHLIESLRSNLAVAYLESDPEQARSVVEKSVKTREAVQTTLEDGPLSMSDLQKCGHARSLCVWATVLARTGQHAAAVESAEKAHRLLSDAMGKDAVDTGRAAMCIAMLHWWRAERRLSKADEEAHRQLSLQRYTDAADALRKGGLKPSHPDLVAAEVNVMLLEHILCGKEAAKDRRQRCLASLRKWQRAGGGSEGALARTQAILDELKRCKEGEPLSVAPLEVPMLRSGLGLLDVMRDVEEAQRRQARGKADSET